MGESKLARSAMIAAALAAGILAGAIVHADPHPVQPIDVGLVLENVGKHAGTPALSFKAVVRNNTPAPMDAEVMFAPPLSGKHVTLPHGQLVELPFSDPGGLGPCSTRDYSVQVQGRSPMASLRVSSSACTFTHAIADGWSSMSPDRQTGSVYLDNPTVVAPPVCAPSHEFMTVRAIVYNRSNLHAHDLAVQLVPPTGAPLGSTPSFDLPAGATATKTVTAGAPASGKIEVRLVDPQHTVSGVLGNPGVYVVVAPTCTIAAQPIDLNPTPALRVR